MNNLTGPVLIGLIGFSLFSVLYLIKEAADGAEERHARHYAHIRTHQHRTSPDEVFSSRADPTTIGMDNDGDLWPNRVTVSGIRGWY